MANFDLTNFAIQSFCPNNEILYDDKGIPSVMVKIPKMTLADLGIGNSTRVHPAFIVNGAEHSAIWISKYQNIIYNGRAYSLPAQDPKTNIDFDSSVSACTGKGQGWHLMTRAEWALIALWCRKNGFMPDGNNDNGKDHSETSVKAIPVAKDTNGKITRVATGTGPLTWSHDGTASGIWDLNGNVHEWQGGIRTVYGEVQVLADNNAADMGRMQYEDSRDWVAIDATTGEYITPDGSGTTANSIKIDYVSGRATYTNTISVQENTNRNCTFGDNTCDSTISEAAKEILYALALLPYPGGSGFGTISFSYNNGASERVFGAGGSYAGTSTADVFYCSGALTRSYTNANLGFRSAFCELGDIVLM